MPYNTHVNMTYNADTMHDVKLIVHANPTFRYRLRIQIAIALVRVAAWIAGFGGVEVRNDGE